jgi:hypothetical protein
VRRHRHDVVRSQHLERVSLVRFLRDAGRIADEDDLALGVVHREVRLQHVLGE